MNKIPLARRFALVGLCLGLASGAASAQIYAGDQGAQEPVRGLLEAVDASGRVIVQSRAELRDQMADQTGKQVQYAISMSTDERSLAAANLIVQAWWKYQDQARWTMSIYANGAPLAIPNPANLPGQYASACVLGLGSSKWGPFPKAAVAITTQPQWVTPGYVKPSFVDYTVWNDKVDLPSKLPIFQKAYTPSKENCPKEPTGKFQDDLLGILPDQFYLAGMKGCVFPGGPCAQTNDYPKPQKIDWNVMRRRQEQACGRIEELYKTYTKEVETARATLSPTPGSGVWWSETNVQGNASKPADQKPHAYFWTAPIQSMMRGIGEGLVAQRITQITALAPHALRYYENGAKAVGALTTGQAPRGNYLEVTGRSDEPGIVQLEEYKRFWPVAGAQQMSKSGYATFFQMWKSPETIVDNKRQMYTFWPKCAVMYPTSPCDPGTSGLPTVQPIYDVSVLPGGKCVVLPTRTGSMTYTDQAHYRWVSVPEGYLIPDVKGTPKSGGQP